MQEKTNNYWNIAYVARTHKKNAKSTNYVYIKKW